MKKLRKEDAFISPLEEIISKLAVSRVPRELGKAAHF